MRKDMGIFAILLLTVLVTLNPAAAHATGVKFSVNSSSQSDRSDHRSDSDRRGDHLHRRPPAVVIVPVPVYVSSPRCAVPGYWTYSWVPQNYVTSVWVPGYYNYDAVWVEGHYEPRAYTWGYYQPYWVPEGWTFC